MDQTRTGFALGSTACALLLGFGFYLQYFDNQDPCPLCLVPRGFYFGLLFVFAAGAGWDPRVADPRGRAFTLLASYKFF